MDGNPQERREHPSLNRLGSSERAVTPVIGIILLVAIAVILSAVVGKFALGLGDQVQDFAPNTRFAFDFDTTVTGETCGLSGGGGPNKGELTMTHEGGDNIDESQLTLVDNNGNRASWNDCSSTAVSEINSGDQATPEVDSDDTIRIVWESENNADDTAVLATYEGPDA